MRTLIRRWFASLVNRAVVFIITGIILSTLVVVIFGAWASRSELESQAGQQVSTIAELVAGDLDSRLAHRPFFIETANQFTPTISEPFVSEYQDKPAIMMTALIETEEKTLGTITVVRDITQELEIISDSDRIWTSEELLHDEDQESLFVTLKNARG